ncbi:hypothetical protein SAMN05421858_3842 [Haladaptatus litoreus]|uniref:Uncharacterized protein n=1 Tax=Haladaptatus litoreus TaxID=553468 RepID=A0A1N7DXU4_9EURY|nr:hypothetical protein SAMN05421858_3842 [Haladaptatus litoreus]
MGEYEFITVITDYWFIVVQITVGCIYQIGFRNKYRQFSSVFNSSPIPTSALTPYPPSSQNSGNHGVGVIVGC